MYKILKKYNCGLITFKIPKYEDHRGSFLKLFNFDELNKMGINFKPKEHFHSISNKNVIRGMHFQVNESAHNKIVHCITGSIIDVCVDIRKESKYYNKPIAIKLEGESDLAVFIPKGFAHGFLTLSDYAEVLYKATQYWNKDSELSLKWNDPNININWPLELLEGELNVSEKDKNAFLLSQLNSEHFFL